MKFKHTFHVFVDNFSVIYKQLLYRLVIAFIALGLSTAVIYPFIKGLTGSPDFISLKEGIKAFLINLVEGKPTELAAATEQIRQAFADVLTLVANNKTNIVWGAIGLLAIHLVQSFFAGLGNYATAAVINDKMALRAKSPFMVTLIRNLKQASLYSIMYIPLSFLYDLICYVGIYMIVFMLLSLIPINVLVQIFLYVTAMMVAIAFKMVFTSDWLPALIRGKMKPGHAFLYTFDRRRKNTFNVLSNFVILILIIFAINVAAIVFTFGAGALIAIPSSYVILVCFEFVNYYDREELKYFIDKHTIIKPEKEKPVSREEFFKGE